MRTVLSYEEIRQGAVTDVYFERSEAIMKAKGLNPRVRMEVFLKPFPFGDFGVLAGTEEAIGLFEGVDVAIESLPEGSVFFAREPVFALEGPYLNFGRLETALLGVLSQSSGIATKAARCVKRAQGRPIIHFGARRMHPAISPMIDYAAYLGGCEGISVSFSANQMGLVPQGTMPHALILVFKDTLEAAHVFDEIIPKDVPRVVLIDTFQDEKFEAIRIAEALRDKLFGLRLDTPGSRRGNIGLLIQEVRWELNLRGFEHVRLFLSGGVKEEDIPGLCPIVDAFGIGSEIASARPFDFSLDIVEVEGEPLAKRGKESGTKALLLCPKCFSRQVFPKRSPYPPCPSCQGERLNLLEKTLQNGKRLNPSRPLKERASFLKAELERYRSRIGL
jgi:nicotinate phosphoribosyltransferase